MPLSKSRLEEIKQLINWKSGGCLAKGAIKPDFPPTTPEEVEIINAYWDTLPGWTSFYDAVRKMLGEY